MIDEKLKEWANPIEAAYIDAFNAHGTYTAAGDALEVHRSTIQRGIDRVKERATLAGYVPTHGLTEPIPAPHILKGMTIQRDADGNVTQTWTKTRLHDEFWLRDVREAISEFSAAIEPIVDIPTAPRDFSKDVIPWIQIGDAHFGMLAHMAETGRNFDLKIAEQELCAAWSILLEEIRPCERIVINDLGDFTHTENEAGKTEASGHDLDVDGRFPKMINVYSRTMRWLVNECLKKAQHVDVIINQGNHSRTNDMWMAELLRVAYGHTGRVHVLNNDNVFVAYRMGKTLVMTHHSDRCPPKRLCGVMISDYGRDFGETDFHYIDVGHIHHSMSVKEHPSITVESFNNLAPMDKWAHDSGYRSKASISVVFRSRTYGEIGRRLLPIQEIWDRLRKAGKTVQPFQKKAFAV